MKYRHYRHECNYRAEIRLPAGRVQAWIANVSASGARVEGLGNQRPGTAVTLQLNGMLHGGRIVWCRGNLSGIRFDRELGKQDLDKLRQRQPGPACHVHRRRMQGAGHHGFTEM